MNTSDERALGIPVLVIKPESGDQESFRICVQLSSTFIKLQIVRSDTTRLVSF